MTSSVSALTSTVKVDQVQGIVLSDIASDGAGGFVRTLKVYGTPGGTGSDPVFTVVIAAATAAPITLLADNVHI